MSPMQDPKPIGVVPLFGSTVKEGERCGCVCVWSGVGRVYVYELVWGMWVGMCVSFTHNKEYVLPWQ